MSITMIVIEKRISDLKSVESVILNIYADLNEQNNQRSNEV